MAYTILDFAYETLKKASNPLVYQEIWELGLQNNLNSKLSLTGKTPWATLGARLFVNVRDDSNSKFIKVGRNPARFWLKERSNEISNLLTSEEIISKPEKNTIKLPKDERELHPLVAYFAHTNNDFNKGKAIYTKTIYHEKSKKNTSLNEWVHPDMVGFYIPIDDWNEKLLEFNTYTDTKPIKLYSFEIKKTIDKSNYREYFFQAVSNSSWANEGYLISSYIKPNDDLYSELERLSVSFGIGIIQLDLEDIDSSKVIFPARTKSNLDWELMNKLCDQNPDFENFIDRISKDFKVKTIHKSEYDSILEDPESYTSKILK